MEYHFVITVQRPAPGGGADVVTVDGCGQFAPGATRAQAFDWAWKLLCQRHDWPPRTGAVLFFSLTNNSLT